MSHVLRELSLAGLEMVDAENLRPHYARTLWAWSDALEERLDEASRVLETTGSEAQRGQGAARLPPVPGRLRDELRTGLDLAAPGAGGAARRQARDGVAAGRTIGLPVQPRLHLRQLMLYKFKSKAAGDLIMLEPNGRRVLEIIGKDPGPKGIIETHQMAAAIQALEAAIVREEAEQQAVVDEARAKGQVPPTFAEVSLRQRALPFIDMLTRCEKAGKDIVWGV